MSEKSLAEYIQNRYFQSNAGDQFGIASRVPDTVKERIARMAVRADGIAHSAVATITENIEELNHASKIVSEWIENRDCVRVLGAGRALIAASLAGNRLAHAGAVVSFMGGLVPLPNSINGGGIIAASASGKTKPVLEAMAIAKRNNPGIRIIGIASVEADQFSDLCDVFIGLVSRKLEVKNPLSALADVEELIIAEVLDALVVMSGQELGFDDESWRRGHEDIGPTGPYAPQQ